MQHLFLICIIPPFSVTEDIDEIRNHISEKYNVHESLRRPAHITLYHPAKVPCQKENRFFNLLEEAAYLKPFEQVLKNFKSFPPHTVYIDVMQNESITKLHAQIKSALSPLNLIPAKNISKFTPHLTIAFKDLKPPVHQSILEEYEEKHFKRTFMVNGFSVYKHIDKRWRPFREIRFKNPADKPKPLLLF